VHEEKPKTEKKKKEKAQ